MGYIWLSQNAPVTLYCTTFSPVIDPRRDDCSRIIYASAAYRPDPRVYHPVGSHRIGLESDTSYFRQQTHPWRRNLRQPLGCSQGATAYNLLLADTEDHIIGGLVCHAVTGWNETLSQLHSQMELQHLPPYRAVRAGLPSGIAFASARIGMPASSIIEEILLAGKRAA